MKKLEQRVKNLEDQLNNNGLNNNGFNSNSNNNNIQNNIEPEQVISIKLKKKPSEYNIFMSDYIKKNKNSNKPPKILISEGAKEWKMLKDNS